MTKYNIVVEAIRKACAERNPKKVLYLMNQWNKTQSCDGVFFGISSANVHGDGIYIAEYDWDNNNIGTIACIPF